MIVYYLFGISVMLSLIYATSLLLTYLFIERLPVLLGLMFFFGLMALAFLGRAILEQSNQNPNFIAGIIAFLINATLLSLIVLQLRRFRRRN